MRSHHNAFASLDGRRHGIVPKRNDAVHGVFQAFSQRNVGRLEFGVAQVCAFAAWVLGFQCGRGGVVAAAPYQNLLIAKFFGGLGFVQTLQRAVMAFIEAPIVVNGQPLAVHGIQGVPQGVNGPLENAGVGQVKLIALSFKKAASRLGLFNARGCQVNVGPTREAVF